MKKVVVWGSALALLAIGTGRIWAQNAQDGDNTAFNVTLTDGPNDCMLADTNYYGYSRSVVTGSDLDQDGLKEIIVSDYYNGGRIHVFEVTDGALTEVWCTTGSENPYGYGPRSVTTGDLDGDGYAEIIVAMTGGGGDTNRLHVGLWVYEWNGNDNEYGEYDANTGNWLPSERIIEFGFEGDTLFPDRYRCEDLAVGDFDNDGVQEVLWVNNGGSAFDNAYIFSIVGDIGSHFITVDVEAVFKRLELGWGGSSVSGLATDLDADGNTDLVVMVWNNIGFQIIEATAPNTYEAKAYFDNIDSEDRYPFGKIVGTYDLDNDGKPEMVIGALLRSRFYVVEAGDDVTADQITIHGPVEFMENDTTPMYSLLGLRVGDQDHGPGTDAADIYFTDDYRRVVDLEFTGTDLGDPASYTAYTLMAPEDFWQDSAQFTDSLGNPVWVHYWLQPSVAIALGNDLDDDGNKEVVFCSYEARDNSDYPRMTVETGLLSVLEFNDVGVEEWTLKPNDVVHLNLQPTLVKNEARLAFNLRTRGRVTAEVFDVSGRRVATVFQGQLEAGSHTLTVNAASLASGVYVVRLTTPDGIRTARMVVAH